MELTRRELLIRGGLLGLLTACRVRSDENHKSTFQEALRDPSLREDYLSQRIIHFYEHPPDGWNFPRLERGMLASVAYTHTPKEKRRFFQEFGAGEIPDYIDGALMVTIPVSRVEQHGASLADGSRLSALACSPEAYDFAATAANFDGVLVHELAHVLQINKSQIHFTRKFTLTDLEKLDFGRFPEAHRKSLYDGLDLALREIDGHAVGFMYGKMHGATDNYLAESKSKLYSYLTSFRIGYKAVEDAVRSGSVPADSLAVLKTMRSEIGAFLTKMVTFL